MSEHSFAGLVIYGFPDPLSPASGLGCIFTNGEFQLPPSLAALTPRAHIKDIGGETYTANLRNPCAAGGGAQVTLEEVDGSLCSLLVPDATQSGWGLETHLTPTTLAFVLTGPTAPTLGQLLWVEEEAVSVDAVAVLTPTSYLVTVTRARCASFAKPHRLIPSVYYVAGSDGTGERILVQPRPDPARHRFLCTLYRFREVAGAPVEISKAIHGYLLGQPYPTQVDAWQLRIEPVSKLIETHPYGANRGAVRTSRCIEIITLEERFVAGSESQIVPQEAALYLTGYQSSVLFNEPTRQVGESAIDPALVASLATKYTSPSEVRPLLFIKAGGSWLFELSGLEFVDVDAAPWAAQESFVRVRLRLLADDGSSLGNPLSGIFPGILAGVPSAFTIKIYAGGWSVGLAAPLGWAGASPPEIELRFLATTTVSRFFSYLLVSDAADSASSFDVIPGRVGLGLPESFLNLGPVFGPPADKDTLELRRLDTLLTNIYSLPIQMKGRLADELNHLCRLHLLLVTPLSSGALTLRYWARPFLSTANPIVLEQTELEVLQDVKPLRALEFVSGVNLLTFEPASPFPRLITVQGSKVSERGDVERVWVYEQGVQVLSDQAFADGIVGECARAFLLTLQGEPLVLRGNTDLDVSPYETADYVTLTDEFVPTYLGRGVSNKRYIIISLGLSWGDSGQPVLLLPDELNNAALQTVGRIAPSLRLLQVRQQLGNVFTLRVSSIGEDAFDATTAHGGIWAALAASAGEVRLVRYTTHAQVLSASIDRQGWLECYGTVIAVRFISPESEIDLSISALWEYAGLTRDDYLVPGETFVLFSDKRGFSRIFTLLEPIPEQRYNNGLGLDFAKFDGPYPYDQHRSLIGP